MRGLLESHRVATAGETAATATSEHEHSSPVEGPLRDLYRCLGLLLSASMRSAARLEASLPHWTASPVDAAIAPSDALNGAATVLADELAVHEAEYRDRCEGGW